MTTLFLQSGTAGAILPAQKGTSYKIKNIYLTYRIAAADSTNGMNITFYQASIRAGPGTICNLGAYSPPGGVNYATQIQFKDLNIITATNTAVSCMWVNGNPATGSFSILIEYEEINGTTNRVD